jgi:hypothetical protein
VRFAVSTAELQTNKTRVGVGIMKQHTETMVIEKDVATMVTSAAGAADSAFDDGAAANAEDDGASVEMEEKVADGVTFHSKVSADSSTSSRIDVSYFFSLDAGLGGGSVHSPVESYL